MFISGSCESRHAKNEVSVKEYLMFNPGGTEVLLGWV